MSAPYYMYSKMRREFGRPCVLADAPAEVPVALRRASLDTCRSQATCVQTLVDIRPNPSLFSEFVDRAHCNSSVQVGPEYSEHEVRVARYLSQLLARTVTFGIVHVASIAQQANTQQILHRTQGMSHTEGGWPKDVDCTEAEHVIRFRRKIEKDEDYVRSIVTLGCKARVEKLCSSVLGAGCQPAPAAATDAAAAHRWRRSSRRTTR